MEGNDKVIEGMDGEGCKSCGGNVLIAGKELGDWLSETLNNLLVPAAAIETLKRKEYLTEHEVAHLYSVSTSTLRAERSRRQGPVFIKDGKRILYNHKDLREYYERRRVKTRG